MGIIHAHGDVAEAARDCVFRGRVVSHIGRAGIFDIADEPAIDLGRFGIGVAVGWMSLDGRFVLPRVVDDLTDERRQPVDRQTWGIFGLAILYKFRRPL